MHISGFLNYEEIDYSHISIHPSLIKPRKSKNKNIMHPDLIFFTRDSILSSIKTQYKYNQAITTKNKVSLYVNFSRVTHVTKSCHTRNTTF